MSHSHSLNHLLLLCTALCLRGITRQFIPPVWVGFKIFPTSMPRASQHLVQRLASRAASRGLKGAFSDFDGTRNALSAQSAVAPGSASTVSPRDPGCYTPEHPEKCPV